MTEKLIKDLRELKKLIDEGVINQEEFDSMKSKIINGDYSINSKDKLNYKSYGVTDYLELNIDDETVSFKLDNKGLTIKHDNGDKEVFIRQQDLIMKHVREKGAQQLVISDFINKSIKYTLDCTSDDVYGIYNKYKKIKGYSDDIDYVSGQYNITKLELKVSILWFLGIYLPIIFFVIRILLWLSTN